MNGEKVLAKVGHKAKVFVKKNSATILTCVGAAGVVATAVTAVKATPKAVRLLEEAKAEKGEELTKWEVVKTAGPAYIPSVAIGAGTIACIFGANILNKRHQAAIMSAYAMLDQSYKEYRNKTNELYGEDADQNIRKEIAKDKYKDQDIEMSGEGNKQLFFDEFSGRYFEASMEEVLAAEYKINRMINIGFGAYLNEFYELLGLEPVDYGEYLGWNPAMLSDMFWNSWVDFTHFKTTMDDGLECTIISIDAEPQFGFEDY